MAKGKQAGVIRYNNTTLFQCVKAIEPTCMEEWKQVATNYKALSNEDVLRDYMDVRRHWVSIYFFQAVKEIYFLKMYILYTSQTIIFVICLMLYSCLMLCI